MPRIFFNGKGRDVSPSPIFALARHIRCHQTRRAPRDERAQAKSLGALISARIKRRAVDEQLALFHHFPRVSTIGKRVGQSVCEGIGNRVYAPGERLPSTSELCALYGVSHITVSAAMRELKEQGRVESRGRADVWALETTTLTAGKREVVACVLPDLHNPFFAQILKGHGHVPSNLVPALASAP